MSQALDALLSSMSTAASSCYDLNGNGNLPVEEQTVFYQFAEHIVFLLGQMHADYDAISKDLATQQDTNQELDGVWASCNSDLHDFRQSLTSPKMRKAVATTAFAIDRTSSYLRTLAA